jgi:hypothetical protein
MPLANTVPEPPDIIVGGAPQGSPIVPSVIRAIGIPFTKTLALPDLTVSPQVNGSPILAIAGMLVFM